MEVSKNTKTVKLNMNELKDAIQTYLLSKDIEGTIKYVDKVEKDISEFGDHDPHYQFTGVIVTVES